MHRHQQTRSQMKSQKNAVIVILLFAGLLAVATSVAVGSDSKSSAKIRSVTLVASWAKAYSTLGSLRADADAIVDGKIDSIVKVVKDPQQLVFTDYWLTGLRVVYDRHHSLESSSRVLIHQTGGIFNGVRYEMTDDPLFRTGEHVVVFLHEYAPGRYYVIGGPTGRFEVVGGLVRPITSEGLKMTHPITESTFLDSVR